jgi:hypothetical protein
MSQLEYPSAEDVLFEWKESVVVRQKLFVAELRLYLIMLPILFPVLAGFGFFLFAMKVWRNGHSLREIPFRGLLLASGLLATVFSLIGVTRIVIQRFCPTTVRLKANTIEKRKDGWGREFTCEYGRIRQATLTKHELASDVSAILVTLKSGEKAFFALPDSAVDEVLEILKRKGVRCALPVGVTETPGPGNDPGTFRK